MDGAVVLAGEPLGGFARTLIKKKAAQGCLLIAADAGADRLADVGLTPSLIVGDGDSLRGAFPGVPRQAFPRRKDFTDGEAALELALSRCDGDVWLLGVLGGRPDHQLANLLLPLHCSAPERVALAGEDWQGRYLGPGRHIITGRPGDTVSLLPLTEVSGLTLTGFEYPLQDHAAVPGDSRTVSNVLSSSEAGVSIDGGRLLAIRIMSSEEIDQYERDR